MSNIDFIDIDSRTLYQKFISAVEEEIGEDLPEGDERRLYSEALVAVLEALFATVNDSCRQRLLRYARGEVLDALGENRGITRQESVKATCTVRFSIEEAISSNITIPQGTRVTSDSIRYFSTDVTAVLTAGLTYVDVECTAKEGGAKYNDIAIGEIKTLVDQVPYIDSVSNTTSTTGGSDEETDDEYRDRIRAASAATSVAGPKAYYRYHAINADPTIADAYIDSPSPGVVRITPICYGGEIPGSDLLAKVLAKCSADDVRVLTDQVTTAAPDIEQYNIELKYYTTSEDESACIETIEGDDGAIAQYNAWQCSALDRDINPDKLRALMLAPSWESEKELVGCTRVEIVSPVFTELDARTVAKFSGTMTVTHEVEG
ncbi:MAG: baseplate J/gp47 family protein [Butyrivibrio sp.]|nr:baseplate J/gp47 family protein [Butyrivibrio sp.]